MLHTTTQLTQARVQFLRTILLSLCATALFVVGVAAILLFFVPATGVLILIGLVSLSLLGSSISLYLLKTAAVAPALLPVVILFMLTEVGIAIFLPEIRLICGVFLTFLVQMISLAGNRRLTTGVAIAATLLFMGMLSLPRLDNLAFTLDIGTRPIEILAAGSVVILTWLIADRFSAAQAAAIALTERRAADAESARAESEIARRDAEQRSEEQQRLLELVQSLELPIIPIGQGVLIAPLVGNLDSRRIEAIQRRLLDTVAHSRAHTVVLDLTGVSVIDTAVARALLMMAQAIRLLGAQTLISGISAHIAQVLVSLGISLDSIQTFSNLGQALDAAQTERV